MTDQTKLEFDAPSNDGPARPVTLPDPPQYVKPTKPSWRSFVPGMSEPMPISRSALELFNDCPRCFYLDKRLKVKRPSFAPYTLNSAVDALLKKEFDAHRRRGDVHPFLAQHGLKLVPFSHPDIDIWRENFVGLQHLHTATNFLIFGAVDDIWITPERTLVVVDYKATRTDKEISLDDKWKQAYKRQMDVYTWLLRQNGWPLAPTTYFLFANGSLKPDDFNARLEFDLSLLPYEPDDGWVEPAIRDAHACLMLEALPAPGSDCEHCRYRSAARQHE